MLWLSLFCISSSLCRHLQSVIVAFPSHIHSGFVLFFVVVFLLLFFFFGGGVVFVFVLFLLICFLFVCFLLFL